MLGDESRAIRSLRVIVKKKSSNDEQEKSFEIESLYINESYPSQEELIRFMDFNIVAVARLPDISDSFLRIIKTPIMMSKKFFTAFYVLPKSSEIHLKGEL